MNEKPRQIIPPGFTDESSAMEDLRLSLHAAYLALRKTMVASPLEAARKEVLRLGKLDSEAERNLVEFVERIERLSTFGRIVPMNAITLRHLYEDHKNVRKAYNEAAQRYQNIINQHRKCLNLTSLDARAKLLSELARKRIEGPLETGNTISEKPAPPSPTPSEAKVIPLRRKPRLGM